MDVVDHYDVLVQSDVPEAPGDLHPTLLGKSSNAFVKEERLVPLRADRHEIRPG
jgi:hypothetical protein